MIPVRPISKGGPTATDSTAEVESLDGPLTLGLHLMLPCKFQSIVLKREASVSEVVFSLITHDTHSSTKPMVFQADRLHLLYWTAETVKHPAIGMFDPGRSVKVIQENPLRCDLISGLPVSLLPFAGGQHIKCFT